MNGKIGLRIVAGLVLLAAIAGVAFFAFQAGVAKGSPITIQAPSGDSNPAPGEFNRRLDAPFHDPRFGYGMRFHHPFGFGFGCFGPLLALLLLLLAFKAFRVMMWGPRWGWGHHHGWGERGVPPMFEEWHKKMHGEQQPEEKKE